MVVYKQREIVNTVGLGVGNYASGQTYKQWQHTHGTANTWETVATAGASETLYVQLVCIINQVSAASEQFRVGVATETRLLRYITGSQAESFYFTIPLQIAATGTLQVWSSVVGADFRITGWSE